MKFLSFNNRCSLWLLKKTDGEEGFTLLEAMIAAAIFGIFMMAVISMLTGAINANKLARDVTEASALAADVVERLASLPYEDADLQNNTVSWPDTEDGKYSFAISTTQDAIVDHTMSVAVTVSWRDRGITRNVTINDIIVDFI